MSSSGRYLTGLVLALIAAPVPRSAQAANGEVRVNSVGYPRERAKVATVLGGGSTFAVRRTGDDGEALIGTLSAAATDPDTMMTVSKADFSALTAPGTYYLDIPTVGRSASFTIGAAPYQDVARTVMLGFLGWRCGTAVSFAYKGQAYAHKACHLGDGLGDYIGEAGVSRDGTGGWHDAGDYGKYTVNGAFAVGLMMDAWERHQEGWAGLTWDIPEKGGAMPDLLDEIKWELDWLVKMQVDADGKVSHKLTRTDFEGFVMPEADTGKRFFVPYGTAATADLVAALAQGARIFAAYDAAAAARYRQAADLSYTFLNAIPANVAADQTDFKTGGYTTADGDDRLWAAAEMWETTGDAAALADLETRIAAQMTTVDTDFDWGNVKNLGMLTYLLSARPGRNETLVKTVRDAAVAAADSLMAAGQVSGFGRAVVRYYWGSNGGLARTALLLDAVNKLTGDARYLDVIVDQLSWLFGRNQYGRSQVTGVGLEPPLTPHHRPSAADGVKDPFPGLLVGGGSKVANWVDEQANYEVNEVAINWNASLVYALGVFLSAQGSSDGDDGGLAPADVEVAPEPPSTRPGGCGCVLEGAPGDLPGLGVTAVAVGAAFFLRRNRRPPAAH